MDRTPNSCKAIEYLRAASPPLAVALLIAFYQAYYAFSYFPITEGWFSVYGSLIRSGAVPYRDFPLLLPPLYPLQIAAVQLIFGESLVVARVFGVFITCGIGIALWAILARFFPRWISAFAAAIATIYYQSGVAFIGYDFTQVMTLYLLMGGGLMIIDIERGGNDTSRWLQLPPIFFSGICLAAATLTKQSNGGLTTLVLGVVFVLIVLRTESASTAIKRLSYFALGGLALLLPILVWLSATNALPSFYHQVVVDAMAAKGGGRQIFSGWISGVFDSPDLIPNAINLFAQLASILFWTGGSTLAFMLVLRKLREKNIPKWMAFENWNWTRFSIIAMSVVGFFVLFAIVLATRWSGPLLSLNWERRAVSIYNQVILFSLWLYVLGCILTLVLVLVRPTRIHSGLLVLSALGLGLMIGNGTSAGLSEISAFIGLAIGIALLLVLAAPLFLPSIVPLGLSLLLSAFLIERKFEMPYAWWSVQTQDVRRNDSCMHEKKILSGICMEVGKRERIEEVLSSIATTTDSGDRLFVFPHMPIFNLLSNRLPYENAVVTWFDFTSDSTVESLVNSLLTNPPKAILIGRLPKQVFEAHERLFRDGKPSVQRKVVAAVDSLIANREIVVIKQTEIDGIKIELYVRSR